MAEEPLLTDEISPSYEGVAETPEDEPRSRRDTWNAAGLVILLVVVFLIVWLLRDCARPNDRAGVAGGRKEIVAVPRYEPMPGAVSVWVSDQTTIDRVLRAAGVRRSDIISLGGGRYVLSVQRGLEQATIDELKSREGVFDAGLVYDRDNPAR
jgi:hypothetical protein